MYSLTHSLSAVLVTRNRKMEQVAPSLPQVAQSLVKRQTGK